jgi:hypothetical protein
MAEAHRDAALRSRADRVVGHVAFSRVGGAGPGIVVVKRMDVLFRLVWNVSRVVLCLDLAFLMSARGSCCVGGMAAYDLCKVRAALRAAQAVLVSIPLVLALVAKDHVPGTLHGGRMGMMMC